MRLQQIGNKQAHILHTRNSDSMVLFSYETPVARYDLENDELLVLTTEGINHWLMDHGRKERKNFPTTTRHINEFKRILTDMNLLSGVTTMILAKKPEHII